MSHTFKNPSRDNLRPVHRFISHWPKSCKTANTEFKNSVFKSRKKNGEKNYDKHVYRCSKRKCDISVCMS